MSFVFLSAFAACAAHGAAKMKADGKGMKGQLIDTVELIQ